MPWSLAAWSGPPRATWRWPTPRGWGATPPGRFPARTTTEPDPSRDTTRFRAAAMPTYVGLGPGEAICAFARPLARAQDLGGLSSSLGGLCGWTSWPEGRWVPAEALTRAPILPSLPPYLPPAGAAGHSSGHEPHGREGPQLRPHVGRRAQPVFAHGQPAPPRQGEGR